jgi:UV DNA damage endonuclease
MSVNFGYCCISELVDKEIKVNRGMIKKTFDEKGINYVSELIILNLADCLKILKHNVKNDIFVYRMSSDMFPWFSHYNLEDLPNFDKIHKILKDIGNFISDNNIRSGFHPAQFCILSSEKQHVVDNSIDELNKTAKILDLMALPANNFYSINIHLNSTKPTLEASANRFCENFQHLSQSAKNRLTVENDDKQAQFTIQDLYKLIHLKVNIPIIADSLHHYCHSSNYSWEDSFKLALSTWKNIRPLCHHSSSKKLHEDNTATLQSHSDYLYEKFENFGIDVDVELECKRKDIALLKYRKDYE